MCVAVPGVVAPGIWLGWPAPLPAARPPMPFTSDLSPDFFELPPGLPYWQLLPPMEIILPPAKAPQRPIPEPWSALLLLPALAALAIWRKRCVYH